MLQGEDVHDQFEDVLIRDLDVVDNHRRYQENVTNLIKPIVYLIFLGPIVALAVTDIVILALSWNQSCGHPLWMWILVNLILTFVNNGISYLQVKRPDNRTLKSMASFSSSITLCWLIIAIFLVSDPQDCPSNMPSAYWLIVAHIVIGPFMIFLTCFCVLGSACCLFCLAQVMLVRIVRNMHHLPIRLGATEDELSHLPSYPYVKDSLITGGTVMRGRRSSRILPEDATCAICLTDYENNDHLRILGCSHHFHQECCDQWLKVNRSCPYCRSERLNSAEEYV